MIKKYIFAGLDFIFDKDEKPYFLEANSAPGGAVEAADFLKHSPLKAIAHFMTGKNPCVVIPKIHQNDQTYKELCKYVPGLKLCYCENNRNKRKYLQDKENNKFQPTCIYRSISSICPSFSKKILVINPLSVTRITKNKDLTYKTVKNIKGIKIPEYYIIKNKKDFNKVKNKFNDFVIKPLDGSCGKGIFINKVPRITHPMIIQKRILPKKIKNKFWDVRVYVVNGKYISSFIRSSRKIITNISQGGKVYPLPKRFERKIIDISEKITKAIHKAVQ